MLIYPAIYMNVAYRERRKHIIIMVVAQVLVLERLEKQPFETVRGCDQRLLLV